MEKFVFTCISVILFNTCAFAQQENHHSADSLSPNDYLFQSSAEELSKIFDSSERDAWQKPEEVIKFLGDITNKTVVDLGCGSGYFSFRLAHTGANVIAADIDSSFLAIVERKRVDHKIDKKYLKTQLIDEARLNIEGNSADIIFLVNAYHHISDRVNYFSGANKALKQNGKIVIVDFYNIPLPIGPPVNHKVSKDQVLDELKKAGYQSIEENTNLLEYQYIITVEKF